MRGLAAEFSGARDWMKVATAWLVGESGISPYTCTIKNRPEFNMFQFHREKPNAKTTGQESRNLDKLARLTVIWIWIIHE